jgi:hypothetical protein
MVPECLAIYLVTRMNRFSQKISMSEKFWFLGDLPRNGEKPSLTMSLEPGVNFFTFRLTALSESA